MWSAHRIGSSQTQEIDARPGSECLDRLRRGSAEALDELLHGYWKSLAAYAEQLVDGRSDLAEDLVQEAFVRLWEKRATWRESSAPAPILYTLVRNLALNEKRNRATRSLLLRLQSYTTRAGITPERELEGRELGEAIDRAVEALPARRREVFRLAWFHGLSYQEVADVLSITPRTVANQMSSALKELRAVLGTHLEESRTP
jgi:RNA polymerase sigma-70 factor, ECF subfamily